MNSLLFFRVAQHSSLHINCSYKRSDLDISCIVAFEYCSSSATILFRLIHPAAASNFGATLTSAAYTRVSFTFVDSTVLSSRSLFSIQANSLTARTIIISSTLDQNCSLFNFEPRTWPLLSSHLALSLLTCSVFALKFSSAACYCHFFFPSSSAAVHNLGQFVIANSSREVMITCVISLAV